ncbi:MULTISPECIES: hypothetical protein [Pseudoalteromonas]|uniref:Uncharacterized protein n=1 Tax=Pseudoalteromonas luteoviolacea (strain 2ta16) TaxID=1353533 RepID=V4J5B5_PSEL2|nr:MULTISPECIES: hypothetical protein [Pseudoalteromonas]ESP90547.1 hypothetical protein PL2TA16_01651 [Pseudoalteromonas luteoviolacea 2ta16]KZN41882.1 hypothetical protein N483_14520 [Pseudoalteromonas luteoviolacea NCIMB 1944]MCG7550477.1 hypothetical protein [Pseudoalteromonas sp. Of7M-16]
MKIRKALISLTLASAVFSINANAKQDITFKLAATTDGTTHSVPMPIAGQNPFSFDILLDYQYQTNGGRCIIVYHQDSCTIENMNGAVTLSNIHWGRASINGSIQQISNWMYVNPKETSSTVLIPSSNVHFYYINNDKPTSTLNVYGRSSLQISNYGRASLQTTKNANNAGFEIARVPASTSQDGVKFPMMAGCINLAVLNTTLPSIARVNFTEANQTTGPITTTLCVPGNDTTTFVGIDAKAERIANITAKVPTELKHLY